MEPDVKNVVLRGLFPVQEDLREGSRPGLRVAMREIGSIPRAMPMGSPAENP